MVSKGNHQLIIAQIGYSDDPKHFSAKSWCAVSPEFLQERIRRVGQLQKAVRDMEVMYVTSF